MLKMGGKPLVLQAAGTLEPFVSRITVITNVPERYLFLKKPLVSDVLRDKGPLGGIFTGLVNLQGERGLFLACDMPFVSSEILRALVEVKGYDVVIPEGPDGLEPLCGVYSRKCLPAIQRQIKEKDCKITNFFPRVTVRVLKTGALNPSELSFFNVNTPQDYARAKRQTRLKT